MANRTEIGVVYGAAIVQGLALVTFPAAKHLLGNFPQAFSHIALVNTAHNLERAEKPCEQRSGNVSLGKAAE